MKKKRSWKHKNHPGSFTGHYVRDADGERNFVLKRVLGDGIPGKRLRRITFESHEAAKALGWKASIVVRFAKR
jgi:hypothetical protein